MGKIADAYVEIGAKTSGFANALGGLKSQLGGLLDSITGVSGSAEMLSSLLAGGFGKALLVVGGLTAAVGAAALALDALYSRDDDQKFADSVAGLTGGFRGLSEQIKHTDKKIQEIMSRDATGGNGGWFSLSSWKALGERVIGVETMSSQIARNMNNAVTASKLFADNMVRAAIAGQQQSDQKLGAQAAAGMIKTAGMREEERISTEAFKRVLDEQGGARIFEQLREEFRKNPGMLQAGQSPMEAAQMAFGQLSRGDQAATKLFGNLFDLPAERAKVLAEEFDKATGAVKELAKIEKERADQAKKERQEQIKRMNAETEAASKEKLRLEDQIEKMGWQQEAFEQGRADRMRNAFNFQGLAQARDNLFNAAMDNRKDELTASKMKTEFDRLIKALDTLKARWNMVD